MPTPKPFPNLGGQRFEEDGTEYSLKLGAVSTIPETYMPESFFKRGRVFYQRNIPDCGANAGAFAAALIDENPLQEYSPDAQWIDIKTFDGYALGDGTDMKSIFKSLTNGSLPYALLPEETTLPLTDFSSPKRLTAAMKKEMAKHKIAAYGFHPSEQLSMATLKNLIHTHKAVVVLIRLGDEFWTDKKGNNSWAEKDILPLRSPKSIISGHFIVFGAYDKDQVYFANWFSKDWGAKGYGYCKDNYLKQIVQIGTLVDSLDAVIVPEFKKDLFFGITDPDVRKLQMWLNTHGYPVAIVGPGGIGWETDYYGTATQKAVQKLQLANGIVPAAGYFGPKTRAWVNAKQ